MKQSFKGWAGKSGLWFWNRDSEQREVMVFNTRGTRSEWDVDDWPPVRVKVTIENLHKPNTKLTGGLPAKEV